ncbi:kinase-like domain-containing protein [Cantharellus anzutake]|uniref:kinase-like domain-containing protein n=1 Tax=Cantharellus anzutake TaxID=1750568 RepID=UPI0019072912|nr:kinase-like domain-containing protein [Cantharellus anzutake]KAF8344066.1 kinase-like domain-containing protein [Cantharellus anzutake]
MPRADQGDEMKVQGLQHSEVRLDARRYKSPQFTVDLLHLLRDELHVPSWHSPLLDSSGVKITKAAGSFTNAVFFVSYSTSGAVGPRTILLRIYGPSSAALISRPHELRTLHVLSSVYKIGPRVFGTFVNGRVEEYLESSALTANDLRDPQTSRWIARRMKELHWVDIPVVWGERRGCQDILSVKNFRDWLAPAAEALDLVIENFTIARFDSSHPWWNLKNDIDLPRLVHEWTAYMAWMKEWEKTHKRSPRVFAHNDAQCGNLLRLARPRKGQPDHHNIIVVDFEYAGPNLAACDIANHFLEWTANYHSDTPHVVNPELYPSEAERRNFYRAYLSPVQYSTGKNGVSSSSLITSPAPMTSPETSVTAIEGEVKEQDIIELEEQVRVWVPAILAQWAVWGLVQARDDVLAGGVGEFDYLNYSRGRALAFRESLKELGVVVG